MNHILAKRSKNFKITPLNLEVLSEQDEERERSSQKDYNNIDNQALSYSCSPLLHKENLPKNQKIVENSKMNESVIIGPLARSIEPSYIISPRKPRNQQKLDSSKFVDQAIHLFTGKVVHHGNLTPYESSMLFKIPEEFKHGPRRAKHSKKVDQILETSRIDIWSCCTLSPKFYRWSVVFFLICSIVDLLLPLCLDFFVNWYSRVGVDEGAWDGVAVVSVITILVFIRSFAQARGLEMNYKLDLLVYNIIGVRDFFRFFE